MLWNPIIESDIRNDEILFGDIVFDPDGAVAMSGALSRLQRGESVDISEIKNILDTHTKSTDMTKLEAEYKIIKQDIRNFKKVLDDHSINIMLGADSLVSFVQYAVGSKDWIEQYKRKKRNAAYLLTLILNNEGGGTVMLSPEYENECLQRYSDVLKSSMTNPDELKRDAIEEAYRVEAQTDPRAAFKNKQRALVEAGFISEEDSRNNTTLSRAFTAAESKKENHAITFDEIRQTFYKIERCGLRDLESLNRLVIIYNYICKDAGLHEDFCAYKTPDMPYAVLRDSLEMKLRYMEENKRVITTFDNYMCTNPDFVNELRLISKRCDYVSMWDAKIGDCAIVTYDELCSQFEKTDNVSDNTIVFGILEVILNVFYNSYPEYKKMCANIFDYTELKGVFDTVKKDTSAYTEISNIRIIIPDDYANVINDLLNNKPITKESSVIIRKISNETTVDSATKSEQNNKNDNAKIDLTVDKLIDMYFKLEHYSEPNRRDVAVAFHRVIIGAMEDASIKVTKGLASDGGRDYHNMLGLIQTLLNTLNTAANKAIFDSADISVPAGFIPKELL